MQNSNGLLIAQSVSVVGSFVLGLVILKRCHDCSVACGSQTCSGYLPSQSVSGFDWTGFYTGLLVLGLVIVGGRHLQTGTEEALQTIQDDERSGAGGGSNGAAVVHLRPGAAGPRKSGTH